MSKSLTRVALDRDSRTPMEFHRGGRTYRVAEVQDCWRLVGNWWDGRGERTFFRVLVAGGGIFELAYDHINRIWQLHRVED
jgi:hypothetical protein